MHELSIIILIFTAVIIGIAGGTGIVLRKKKGIISFLNRIRNLMLNRDDINMENK